MNVATEKNRTQLGEILFDLPEWQRKKIKDELSNLGLTEGRWRGIHERVDAHRLPTFVRDVIVRELPDTAHLFNHPKLNSSPQ